MTGDNYQTIYVRQRAEREAMFVLAAIDEQSGLESHPLATIVGLNYKFVFYATRYLRDLHLISLVGGNCHINERGKIALALWRGKQITAAKRRQAERRAA